MPEKEISKSQQTFITDNTPATSFTFSFYKVYKRKPQNRFRVRVVSLGDLEDTSNDGVPNIYVAQGLVGTTGTLSLNSTTSNGMKSNEFCLGILGRSKYNSAATTQNGVLAPAPIEFYTDEVSTSPFKLTAYNMYGAVTTDAYNVAVVFEITELEEY
jgi:hypothetical protein